MIKEKAYAKINIGLDIVRLRPDGYHDIDTIMQSVCLHDEITLRKQSGITVTCSVPGIPDDETNTAYIAALAFCRYAGLNPETSGIHISIGKNIPSRAGLGGGSSDAAAVLRGLNDIYGTNYSTQILRELALEVGSDVPFCIEGGTQRARGRGEKLTRLKSFEGYPVVILMPKAEVDTGLAYSKFSNSEKPEHPDMNAISQAIEEGNLLKLKENIGNTFEKLVFSEMPQIEKALHDILETEPASAIMTGSGAAVFGIYSSRDIAESAYTRLKSRHNAFLTETIGEI